MSQLIEAKAKCNPIHRYTTFMFTTFVNFEEKITLLDKSWRTPVGEKARPSTPKLKEMFIAMEDELGRVYMTILVPYKLENTFLPAFEHKNLNLFISLSPQTRKMRAKDECLHLFIQIPP